MPNTAMLRLVVFSTCAFAIGCTSGPGSPVSPSLGSTPQVSSRPLAAPPAVVALENAFGIRATASSCDRNGCRPLPGYVYEVRFMVRESGGTTGATVKSVIVKNPDPLTGPTFSAESAQSCWGEALRLPPGGTLDRFYTDEGSGWLSYCYVGIGTLLEVSRLELEVQFVDDEGRSGVSFATVTSFRPFE